MRDMEVSDDQHELRRDHRALKRALDTGKASTCTQLTTILARASLARYIPVYAYVYVRRLFEVTWLQGRCYDVMPHRTCVPRTTHLRNSKRVDRGVCGRVGQSGTEGHGRAESPRKFSSL